MVVVVILWNNNLGNRLSILLPHIRERTWIRRQNMLRNEAAEEQKALFLSTQANDIDEKSVTVATDEASLAAGKEIFVANCAVPWSEWEKV